jgi:nitroimidazol reductase NimA-like FMN-containing flavoprotein (pyridoxamine 5'-phosphate oxidase superfamily)
MGGGTFPLELGRAHCDDLLAGSSLGRVGVVVDGRPEIFPVNHVFDEQTRCVLFPAREGTNLHAGLKWPWVAFEVDGQEPDGSGGWSVLVLGEAKELTDRASVARISARRRVAWGTGAGVHWRIIVPSQVTGRRIEAVSY